MPLSWLGGPQVWSTLEIHLKTPVGREDRSQTYLLRSREWWWTLYCGTACVDRRSDSIDVLVDCCGSASVRGVQWRTDEIFFSIVMFNYPWCRRRRRLECCSLIKGLLSFRSIESEPMTVPVDHWSLHRPTKITFRPVMFSISNVSHRWIWINSKSSSFPWHASLRSLVPVLLDPHSIAKIRFAFPSTLDAMAEKNVIRKSTNNRNCLTNRSRRLLIVNHIWIGLLWMIDAHLCSLFVSRLYTWLLINNIEKVLHSNMKQWQPFRRRATRFAFDLSRMNSRFGFDRGDFQLTCQSFVHGNDVMLSFEMKFIVLEEMHLTEKSSFFGFEVIELFLQFVFHRSSFHFQFSRRFSVSSSSNVAFDRRLPF